MLLVYQGLVEDNPHCCLVAGLGARSRLPLRSSGRRTSHDIALPLRLINGPEQKLADLVSHVAAEVGGRLGPGTGCRVWLEAVDEESVILACARSALFCADDEQIVVALACGSSSCNPGMVIA